jgi:hypothetical protein
MLSGGKECTAVEAMRPHCSHCEAVEAFPLLPSPRRLHCFNCAAVEALPLLDGGPRRPTRWPEEIWQQRPIACTSTVVGEQGPIWAQRAQIWALIFFIFEKQF